MAESSREEIAKLEALYASNPEGRVFTHLAEALRKAGELDRARTILEEGLVKHPAYASAHVVLGRVLLDQQSPAEAADAFRRVHALDPHNHVALRSLGDIARKAGNNAEALQYFEELRTLDPGNEELNATIEELSAAPAVMAQPVAAEPEPAEPESEPEPEPEAAPPVSAATDFEEWAPSSTAEQLPGDLAGLAGFESADELPTFEDVDPLAELTALNTSFDAATPEAPPEADLGEPLPTADFSFDGPAEEEPVLDIDALAPLPEFEPADAPLPAAAPAPAPIADAETAATGEVVTETIAELYRSQGLYDRAADVYRTLLAQRPGDSTLEQKLQEVEDLAAGPIPVPQPEPVFPTEPWESPAT